MPQPPPGEGDQIVWPYVISAIKDRVQLGRERYGTVLKTHNGRDALVDAFEEALDLVMYLAQAILERGETHV